MRRIDVRGRFLSYLKKDFDPNHIPDDYEELFPWHENNPSLAELGFKDDSKFIWVQFNSCYSGHTTEFPEVLGILPIDDPLEIGTRAM